MKKLFVLLLLLAVSGCQQKSVEEQKTVEERIKDAVTAAQKSRLDDFSDRRFIDSAIVYIKTVSLFNVKVHYFEVYKRNRRPRIPKHIIAFEDRNNVVRIARNTESILKYIKPFTKNYELNTNLADNLYTRDYNGILLKAMELFNLVNIDSLGDEKSQIIVNTPEDIPGINAGEKKKLFDIGFHPLKKNVFNDRLEISFYTWDYKKLTLKENKIILSEKAEVETKTVLNGFGPENRWVPYY